MSTVEVLTTARARIAERWAQGHEAGRGEGYCVVTATAALNAGDAEAFADRIVRSVIGAATSLDAAEWNDEPYRTQDEVLAAFDRAILLARAGAM